MIADRFARAGSRQAKLASTPALMSSKRSKVEPIARLRSGTKLLRDAAPRVERRDDEAEETDNEDSDGELGGDSSQTLEDEGASTSTPTRSEPNPTEILALVERSNEAVPRVATVGEERSYTFEELLEVFSSASKIPLSLPSDCAYSAHQTASCPAVADNSPSWSTADDAALAKLVAEYGDIYSPWDYIGSQIPALRTATEAWERWHFLLLDEAATSNASRAHVSSSLRPLHKSQLELEVLARLSSRGNSKGRTPGQGASSSAKSRAPKAASRSPVAVRSGRQEPLTPRNFHSLSINANDLTRLDAIFTLSPSKPTWETSPPPLPSLDFPLPTTPLIFDLFQLPAITIDSPPLSYSYPPIFSEIPFWREDDDESAFLGGLGAGWV